MPTSAIDDSPTREDDDGELLWAQVAEAHRKSLAIHREIWVPTVMRFFEDQIELIGEAKAASDDYYAALDKLRAHRKEISATAA